MWVNASPCRDSPRVRCVVQFVHPDVDWLAPAGEGESAAEDWGRTLGAGGLVPLYACTQELARVGLDSSGFRRMIGSVLREYGGRILDPLPAELRTRHRLVGLGSALQAVHFPKTGTDIAKGLRRLKYGELFDFQMKLALQRARSNGVRRHVLQRAERARGTFVDALPFTLTARRSRW